MKIDASAVSARIDGLRRQNGLSQEELAALLRVSQPAVSKYLRSRVPPADTLLRLAQIGRTTVEWILTGQKSYPFGSIPSELHEPATGYDADWQITQKIAALPPPLKEAIMRIVEALLKEKEEGNTTAYAAE